MVEKRKRLWNFKPKEFNMVKYLTVLMLLMFVISCEVVDTVKAVTAPNPYSALYGQWQADYFKNNGIVKKCASKALFIFNEDSTCLIGSNAKDKNNYYYNEWGVGAPEDINAHYKITLHNLIKIYKRRSDDAMYFKYSIAGDSLYITEATGTTTLLCSKRN